MIITTPKKWDLINQQKTVIDREVKARRLKLRKSIITKATKTTLIQVANGLVVVKDLCLTALREAPHQMLFTEQAKVDLTFRVIFTSLETHIGKMVNMLLRERAVLVINKNNPVGINLAGNNRGFTNSGTKLTRNLFMANAYGHRKLPKKHIKRLTKLLR